VRASCDSIEQCTLADRVFDSITIDPLGPGNAVQSLRAALTSIGVSAEGGLRRALETYPLSLRELIRAANLRRPSLTDLEPDDPHTFESFEVEDPQGIAHGGGTLWFLSSQFTIRRCRIESDDPFRPTRVVHGASRHIDELLDEAGLPSDYDHIGDLAFNNSVVFAPVRRADGDGPHLIVGLSTELHVVGWAELSSTTAESACGFSQWNGLLYVPARDNSGQLEAYDAGAFNARLGQSSQWGRRISVSRRPSDDIQLMRPDGAVDRGGMQGVAFSRNGRIYVTRSLGDGPWNNLIYVYSALTGRRFGDGREWDFPGSSDEIEGIEVHPSGVLFLVVADNDPEWLDTDDFDMYTFRFRTLMPTEV
jgi:hypothetical protein